MEHRTGAGRVRAAVIVADSFTEDGGPNALDQHSRRWRCRVVFASPGSDTDPEEVAALVARAADAAERIVAGAPSV